MIQDIAVSKQSTRKTIANEILANLASGLLYPFGIRARRKKTRRLRQQRTLVLIHGYAANSSSLLPIAQYLRLGGYDNMLSFNYQTKRGIDGAARDLKDFLRRHVRGGRIDMVCHSLGGVIARVYIQDLRGARRVDRCVTLGTPHRGTYNSYWVPSRVGLELRPDSRLMRRLEEGKHKGGSVKYLAIIAGSDNVIIPRIFAAHDKQVLHVPNIGHMGLLFSLAVFRATLKHLRS